jgi:3'(2'), 5'-bisphosphate nucleotidase
MENKWKKIIEIAEEAGKIILKHYSVDEQIKNSTIKKEDGSPLTMADLEADKFISRRLKEEFPNIPILSEEGKEVPYSERKKWAKFWLVDPLDGTKEFLSRNGEFTVNIALIENKTPVFGVIYAPAQKNTYYADKEGAFKIDAFGDLIRLKRKIAPPNSKSIRVVGSRSHSNEKFLKFIENLNSTYDNVSIKSVGSSLKFCLLAENEADQYPRVTPTMEWDTAAGHAIAKFSGYQVLSLMSKKEITYNKESLLNVEFIVLE